MKLIEYDSNNSGGSWWLDKEKWLLLEKNGWLICKNREFVFEDRRHKLDKNGFPIFCGEEKEFLGGFSSYAFKKFNSIEEAKKEFEEITGEDTDSQGCECCGQPHNFYEFNY